jgi:hypothetical protein
VSRAALALLLAALALSGCETTQEESAKLERIEKPREAALRLKAKPLDGLSVAHASTKVRVIATAVLHSSEGAAVVVQVRNVTSTALRHIPVEFTVTGAGGRSLYTNDLPGLGLTLVSIPLLGPHASLEWIDDQVQLSASPRAVSARIGEGEPTGGAIPTLEVHGQISEDASASPAYEGDVVNASDVAQHELVVDCVGRRGGRIVAAGRAVLSEAQAKSTTHFQSFFIGEPKGASLEVVALATSPS